LGRIVEDSGDKVVVIVPLFQALTKRTINNYFNKNNLNQ
jgi:hypothetical protein